MKLINHLGYTFELRIEKYQIEYNENKLLDNDFLNASIVINNRDGAFSTPLNFLMVEDFDRMEEWLTLVCNTANSRIILDFVDAELRFMKFTRGNIPYIKIIYQEHKKDAFTWDFIINKKNIHTLRMELQKMQHNYPCRCGQENKHSKITNIKKIRFRYHFQ